MAKKLAPPPGPNANARKDENDDIKVKIEEQRRAARLKAESRRSKRISEKKQDFLETINQAITEMASTTQELASSLTQQESAFSELAASAAQTSQSTAENSAAVSQVRGAVQRINDNTANVLSKAENLQGVLLATSGGINGLITGVTNTARMNQETAALLASLEEQTNDIENSVAGVAASAKKINLHALNAAIEASRAEEYGAGFSIVADEIRKLAEDSSMISEQIAGAVGSMRLDFNTVKEDLAALLEKSQVEADKAVAITTSLESASRDMLILRQGGGKINVLAQSHSSEVEKIMESSATISVAANQGANATQSASSALQQQVKGINSINKNTLDIKKQIADMQDKGFSEAAAEEIATSAEELSAIVEECSSAVAQISSAVAEIAQSAAQQSAVSKSNAQVVAVAEMAANEISEVATANLEKVKNQQGLLKTVDSDSSAMIEAIRKMAENYRLSASRIISLEDSIENLEMASSQLESINVVTNLLAVNGRIESAKAGEQGAGFATVSNDIRTLVSISSEQTKFITMRIRAIQKTVGRVADDVEQAASNMRQEVDRTTESTASLKVVENEMEELVKQMDEIGSAVAESFSAIENIKIGIDQISKAADQAATATQQASVATDQQANGMRELAATVEEIASQADAL